MTLESDLETLRAFNLKVDRLKSKRFYVKYRDATPEVIAHVRDIEFVDSEGGQIEFSAHFLTDLPDLYQDEIDAFVLTYRMPTQLGVALEKNACRMSF